MFECPTCGRKNPTSGFCPVDGAELKAETVDPLLGSEIGSYRIENLLGKGGMGQVYKAVHPTIGSRVAVKVLSYECAQNADTVGRFIDEATAANRIRHESIINILDLNKLPDGRPYIIMEYLDGAALADIVKKQQALPLGGLTRLIGEVLAALTAAHQQGIIHRDLKPDNIFVSPQGRAKVLDFGIAKLKPELSGRTGPTRTGSLLGTPHYMAPEQAMATQVDVRTDIYAVGVMLYEGVTGQRPFQANSLFELLHKQVNEQPVPPRQLRPDLPPDYESVILRAMAKNPDHRFQSTAEMARALEVVSRQLPAHAWSPVTPQGSVGMQAMGPPSVQTPAHLSGAMPTPHSHGGAPTPHSHGGYGQPVGAQPISTNTPMHGQMQPQTAHRVPPRRTGLVIAVVAVALVVAGGAAVFVAGQSGDGDKGTGKSAGQGSSMGTLGSGANSGSSGSSGSLADLGQLGALGTLGDVDVDTDELEDLQAQMSNLADMTNDERMATIKKLTDKQMEMANKATEAALKNADPRARAAIVKAREQARQAVEKARKQAMEGVAKIPELYRPDGFNPKRFDVSDFIGEATSRARAHYSDAELVRIDANGVYPSGHADLTLADNYSVVYRFNSPSRAKPPKDKLVGVKYEPNCKYYVYVTAAGVRPYPLDGWECDEPAIEPTCSLAEVWEQAIDKGAPEDNAVADISLYTAGKRTRWSVRIGDVFSKMVKDSCD